MDGSTLHSAGGVKVGQQSYSAILECQDVDALYTRNECLRWVLFDEAFMIPDDLLGIFAKHFQEAAPRSQFNRYYRRANGELRILGGACDTIQYEAFRASRTETCIETQI